MTTYYTLEAAFTYQATEANDPSFAEWLDGVAVHLEKLDVDDVMIVSDGGDNSFVVSLLVEGQSGDSTESVVGKGMSSLRTAFHACDAETHEWPTPREAMLVYVNIAVLGTSDDEVAPKEVAPMIDDAVPA